MLAFPGMLVSAAKNAGMKVPENPDKFDQEEFPHFDVFCKVQLGCPCAYPGVHFENAKVVAFITIEEIKTVTIEDLISKGLSVVF